MKRSPRKCDSADEDDGRNLAIISNLDTHCDWCSEANVTREKNLKSLKNSKNSKNLEESDLEENQNSPLHQGIGLPTTLASSGLGNSVCYPSSFSWLDAV